MLFEIRCRHASEDIIERFVLNRLSEVELDAFLEHFLHCPICQHNVFEIEEFIERLRIGYELLKRERAPKE